MNKIKSVISSVMDTIVQCLVPVLPVMIGAGMIKVCLIMLSPTVLNILALDSPTYLVLSFVADSGYYFMPVYVAYSASEVFGCNKYIGAMIGAMLIHPSFVSLVESGTELSVFGLPVASTTYGNQVISSLIAIWIMSYVYQFIDKHISDKVKALFVPLLTILIMTPITLCLIGPLGVILGNGLVKLILYLNGIGPLGNAIMCAIIPFITLCGLGGANLSAMILLSASGCDPILFFSNVMYNVILGFVTLAIYLNERKPDTLAAAITSAVAGTSEPALFGVVMKDAKAMLALVAGGFVGGFIAGLSGVKAYAMASFGIFGIVTTIGPESSILFAFVALIAGCIAGFVITFMTHRKKVA